jgi:hypothetical protein
MNKPDAEIQFDVKFPPTLRKNVVSFETNKKKNEYKTCKICLKQYQKWNKTQHERTQYHQLYKKLDEKLKEILHLNLYVPPNEIKKSPSG